MLLYFVFNYIQVICVCIIQLEVTQSRVVNSRALIRRSFYCSLSLPNVNGRFYGRKFDLASDM